MSELKLHNHFFALWPDQTIRDELVGVQKSMSGRDGRIHHPEDLHLTLVFLGKVVPERLECVKEAANSITARPFTLELTKIDYWRRPRILWCGPDQTPDPLLQLVGDLQQRLLDCGFKPEKRIYQPHITLARRARFVSMTALDSRIVWRPTEFVLAGSHSGAKPPRYHVLERWRI